MVKLRRVIILPPPLSSQWYRRKKYYRMFNSFDAPALPSVPLVAWDAPSAPVRVSRIRSFFARLLCPVRGLVCRVFRSLGRLVRIHPLRKSNTAPSWSCIALPKRISVGIVGKVGIVGNTVGIVENLFSIISTVFQRFQHFQRFQRPFPHEARCCGRVLPFFQQISRPETQLKTCCFNRQFLTL